MTVIDLSSRLTNDRHAYEQYRRSAASLVYLSPPTELEDGPGSLDLTVGSQWYHPAHDRHYQIPPEGLELRPRESAVIQTKEEIGMPMNVLGLVTGKGTPIFKGILVSSGKIDPGFSDRLHIGLYNGGPAMVRFKTGDRFCTCIFWQLESGMIGGLRHNELTAAVAPVPRGKRAATVLRTRWEVILPIVISLAALLVAIFTGGE